MKTPISYHVYGAQHAFTVTTSDTRKNSYRTITFEGASFDRKVRVACWDEKLAVQVTRGELPDVIAVLMGWITRMEFKFHGEARNKGYRIEFVDAGRCVLSVFTAGKRHSVALTPPDRLEIFSLAFRQFQRNHGALSSDTLFEALRDTYSRKNAQRPASKTAETVA